MKKDLNYYERMEENYKKKECSNACKKFIAISTMTIFVFLSALTLLVCCSCSVEEYNQEASPKTTQHYTIQPHDAYLDGVWYSSVGRIEISKETVKIVFNGYHREYELLEPNRVLFKKDCYLIITLPDNTEIKISDFVWHDGSIQFDYNGVTYRLTKEEPAPAQPEPQEPVFN